MKKILCCLFLLPLSVVAQDARQVLNFNTGWKFSNQEDLGTAAQQTPTDNNYSFAKWQTVTLPHTAKLEPLVIITPWAGISWYQKEFTAPAAWKQKKISIEFEAVMQEADVWLNGKHLVTHTGGYLPFSIDISNELRYDTPNRLLVKTNNTDNVNIPPGKPTPTLDFCYYSGIYRNVSLTVTNPLHITNAVKENAVASGGIKVWYPKITAQSAVVAVATHLRNDDNTSKEFNLLYKLTDQSGKTIVSTTSSKQIIEAGNQISITDSLLVKNPALWHPDHPALYTLQVDLLQNEKPVDGIKTKIGIRTFEIKNEQLHINGQPVLLVGTNRHQEYPYIGNALSDNAQYRDALKIKQAGFNIVRLSHYPQSPAFMDACDELGLLSIDAIPGWQFIGKEEFIKHSYRDARELIRRDRNHASVVMWEVSLNETGMPNSYMEEMVKIAAEESPETNLITCGWVNKYYDVFIPARQHAKFPDYWKKYTGKTPLFSAEYGDWEYFAQDAGLNQEGYAGLKSGERTSRQLRGDGEKRLLQQALNFQEAHNDNLRNPHLGDANWVMFDYNRGYSPDIESSGIMDIFRLPKFAYHFYATQVNPSAKAIINNTPIVKIASYWNPASEYKNIKVYSNCDEVALYLNNKLVERKAAVKTGMADRLSYPPFIFNLTKFEAGQLKAVGFIKNKIVTQDIVTTAGKAAKIILTYDRSGKKLKADGADIVFVYATVTDKNGTPVVDTDASIQFSIKGNGKLVGQNPIKTEAGIATILLQAGSIAGTITVEATAAGLAPAVLKVNVVK